MWLFVLLLLNVSSRFLFTMLIRRPPWSNGLHTGFQGFVISKVPGSIPDRVYVETNFTTLSRIWLLVVPLLFNYLPLVQSNVCVLSNTYMYSYLFIYHLYLFHWKIQSVSCGLFFVIIYLFIQMQTTEWSKLVSNKITLC